MINFDDQRGELLTSRSPSIGIICHSSFSLGNAVKERTTNLAISVRVVQETGVVPSPSITTFWFLKSNPKISANPLMKS